MGDALSAFHEELRRLRPRVGRPLRPKPRRKPAPIGAQLVRPQPAERRLEETRVPETEEEKFQKRLEQERQLGAVRSDLAAEERARLREEQEQFPKALGPLEEARLRETQSRVERARALTEQGEKRLRAEAEKELTEQQKTLDEAAAVNRGLKEALQQETERLGARLTPDELQEAANVRQKRGETADDVRKEFKEEREAQPKPEKAPAPKQAPVAVTNRRVRKLQQLANTNVQDFDRRRRALEDIAEGRNPDATEQDRLEAIQVLDAFERGLATQREKELRKRKK